MIIFIQMMSSFMRIMKYVKWCSLFTVKIRQVKFTKKMWEIVLKPSLRFRAKRKTKCNFWTKSAFTNDYMNTIDVFVLK